MIEGDRGVVAFFQIGLVIQATALHGQAMTTQALPLETLLGDERAD
jgi:hypothetical protein